MAMKFKPKPEKATIDWVDGSKLFLERPGRGKKDSIIRAIPEDADEFEKTDRFLESFLIGWEGVEDADTGKALVFSDVTRKAIFRELDENMADEGQAAREKFYIFVAGTEGN